MRSPRLLLALLALPLASPPAAATETRAFRCKQDLVQLGDSPATVRQRCGEPVYRDSFCAEARQTPEGLPPPAMPNEPRRLPPGCVAVDEWTYNPGWGQFWTTLRFEGGRLVSIRYGDRVK
ncbi:MAG: DUF2845 domain-containing protein [Burkholderiales bacterium]|nr:DUF2845 domain-containing protein [Burkholderiales bacterium]